jgi:hypothetical protein
LDGVFLSGSLKKFRVKIKKSAGRIIRIIFNRLLCAKKLREMPAKKIMAAIPIVVYPYLVNILRSSSV